jgi:Icc-related predicted phosphoesterase
MAGPATSKQTPDNSILDSFNKQTYLGNQYSGAHTFTVGTTEIPLLLLSNVETGITPTNLVSAFQNYLKVVESTAANSIILNVYLSPTVTVVGTTLTPVNMRPYAPVNNKVALTYTPTVSANGTLVDSINAGALSVGSSSILKIIDQGQSLLVTGIASAAATSVTAILQWYEI